MKVITFANNKGGVGKTTSALAVAHQLAELGHKVWFIDADPQANATITFGLSEKDAARHLGMAIEEERPRHLVDLVSPARIDGKLWVLPSARVLAQREKVFGMTPDYVTFFRRSLRNAEKYPKDYVIFDTAPNLGPLTIAALAASDVVFTPMHPNLFSSEGATALLDMVARVKDSFNEKLKVGGIFFTKYAHSYRKALHKQYAQALADDPALAGLVMNTTIRENVALDEAQGMKQSIFEWAPQSNGAADYRALTDEILQRIK